MNRSARHAVKICNPHPFECALAVMSEELEIELRGMQFVPWADYLLNPRRLRGSDFLMRWSQGSWSEDRVVQAVNDTESFYAMPYGPSGAAPDEDVREFELYFERLDKAGLGNLKRPDILVFPVAARPEVDRIVQDLGGQSELPFTSESDNRMQELLSHAIIAVECENSLWVGRKMPDYGAEMTPQRRLDGRLGLKKNAVVPTIIIKEEDRAPLRAWQSSAGVGIHIWHVFYDVAFGIALDQAEKLIASGEVEPTKQVFQAPGGSTTTKIIYKISYHHAYELGETVEEPTLVADSIMDKNGHVLPYVRFVGGKLALSSEALMVLTKLAETKGG